MVASKIWSRAVIKSGASGSQNVDASRYQDGVAKMTRVGQQRLCRRTMRKGYAFPAALLSEAAPQIGGIAFNQFPMPRR
jgi:hypothetical protein